MTDTLSPPVFVLVEPQMGENIGAAARAMWNFGLDRMRIVEPRDGWPNERAEAMASGASHLLERAAIFSSTREAVADAHHVYATTARPRELTKRVMTPEAAGTEMRARAASGEQVAVLFGRERSGLGTEDIVLANTIVTVPVNPAFPSLNLAQCALLIAYEWNRVADATPPEITDPGRTGPATREQIARFLDFLEAELDEVGFFWPEHKAEPMAAALRNLYARVPLNDADVRMLWGTTRALVAKRKRKSGGAGGSPDSGSA